MEILKKYADMTVFDRNLLEIETDEILEANIAMTIGDIAYARGGNKNLSEV